MKVVNSIVAKLNLQRHERKRQRKKVEFATAYNINLYTDFAMKSYFTGQHQRYTKQSSKVVGVFTENQRTLTQYR